MELWLIADTNLFFECKSLAELPWGELSNDLIVLLLTKPVLDEIDKHKKGSGRTRERALEIFGCVRKMLQSGEQETEIHPTSPRVVMRLENSRPDPALKDVLDYLRTDEKLIGILSTLQSPEHIVKLFTDDTGPASTASGLSLPFQMIDGHWRRPPAESTKAKKIKELEKDLSTYRAQEPQISIETCKNLNASNVLQVTSRVAKPLTEDEIAGIVASLVNKHSQKKDFIPPQPSVATMPNGEVVQIEYLPPPDDAIAEYHDTLYPRWIEKCRGILASLHSGRDEEAPRLIVRWPMSNVGTRPASQVRVVFHAKGPLNLRRLSDEDLVANEHDRLHSNDEAETSMSIASPTFPSPPLAPIFLENVSRIAPPPRPQPSSHAIPSGAASFSGSDLLRRDLEEINRSFGKFDKAANLFSPSFSFMTDGVMRDAARLSALSSSLGQVPSSLFDATAVPATMPIPSLSEFKPRHDPEAFYYDWSTRDAVKTGVLTCDLWRHQTDEELFEFEVLFEKDGAARGTVECTVHAENLTRPQQARVIVARVIERFSVHDIAKAMVTTCR